MVRRWKSTWLIAMVMALMFLVFFAPQLARADDDETWVGRRVTAVRVEGARRVEAAAITAAMLTRPGGVVDASRLREDIRSIWRLGYFDDVAIDGESVTDNGVVLTVVVREKASLRKVYVDGLRELELKDINDVLSITEDTILDESAIAKDIAAITSMLKEKGFYLGSARYELRPVNEQEADLWFFISEGDKIIVRDIEFIGNEAIPDKELKTYMATQTEGFSAIGGTVYQQEIFERDLMIVSAYYWDKGFAGVKVGAPSLRLSADRKFMYVSVPIEEGPVFTVGEIAFAGDLIGDDAKQRQYVRMKSGTRFSRSSIAEDRERLSKYYMDLGYANASISPMTNVDADKRVVNLSYEIVRGKKAFFERINIRGNTKTSDKVIRREMKISEGDLFSQSGLDTSKSRIMATGYFDKVDVSTEKGSSDEFIEVNVEVQERQTGSFQIGAGFSSVDSFILNAQISQENFLGRGHSMTMQAQLSGFQQRFLLRFVEPYFLDSKWTFAFDLYKRSEGRGNEFSGYQRDSVGGSLTWGYGLSYEARAFLTYKLEDVSVGTGGGFADLGAIRTPIDTTSVANLFRGGLISSVRASLVWDSRNDRQFATGGFNHNIFVEYAGKATGSENEFWRTGGFARYYKHLWGPFVLKLNGEVGVVTSPDPLGVPILERYLLGGIYDIRGFQPRTLGPVLRTSPPGGASEPLGYLALGGNAQLVLNAEVEFALLRELKISGVAFVDAGNAYNLEDRYCTGISGGAASSIKTDPCFHGIDSIIYGSRKSTGVGIRWTSPIGPLRFEWGVPLDRLPGEDSLVFEFTIGNFF